MIRNHCLVVFETKKATIFLRLLLDFQVIRLVSEINPFFISKYQCKYLLVNDFALYSKT